MSLRHNETSTLDYNEHGTSNVGRDGLETPLKGWGGSSLFVFHYQYKKNFPDWGGMGKFQI